MIKKVLFACFSLLFGSQLQAAIFTQTLDYTASNQSIWGPGTGSAGFDFSASATVDLPFGLGSPSVGYSVSANSGTVSVEFDGDMSVDYADSIPVPGITSLNLSYQGREPGFEFGTCTGFLCIPPLIFTPFGGSMSSDFGAKAQLLGIGPDFTLPTDALFVPELGTSVSASGSAPGIVQVPIVDIGVASAGAQLGLTQTNSFSASAIEGTLNYSRQGSGVTNTMPFSLGDLGADLDVDLTESGIWDFWFEDQTLDNSFSTAFDLDLDWFAGTFAGCGTFGLSGCDTSGNITSFEIFMVDPFALAFNSITSGVFSIEVGALPAAVPLPAAAWLFGTALIGLLGFGKRRKAA